MTNVAPWHSESAALPGPHVPLVVSGTVHGRPVQVWVSGLPDVVAQIAAWTRDDPDALGSWGLREDYSEPLMIPVRRAPGVVEESKRAAHMVRLLPGEAVGAMLVTLCGARLPLVGVEVLPLGAGMPCERCLRDAATESDAGALAELTPEQPIKFELDTQIG